MQFDPVISFGAIINLAGMLLAGLFAAFAVHWRLKLVEQKLDTMADVLERLARYDERLKHIDVVLDDMKHGKGFVFEQPFGGGAMR